MAKRKRKTPTPAQERRISIIRAWLDFNRISISELGRRVSGSENVIKDILSGKVRQPTERTIRAIARHIGVEPNVLEDPSQPLPRFGYGSGSCGHALVRIPEAVIARDDQQELNFVPFPGAGMEARLDQIEHLSMAGAGGLRIWRIWHQVVCSGGAQTYDKVLVDIADRSGERSGDYVVIDDDADVGIRNRENFTGDERAIGRIVRRLSRA